MERSEPWPHGGKADDRGIGVAEAGQEIATRPLRFISATTTAPRSAEPW